MPRQRVLSGDDVCRILILHGFEKVRQKGSHIAMRKRLLQNSGNYITVSVVVPNHKELKRGTLASIIRQSGLPKEHFR